MKNKPEDLSQLKTEKSFELITMLLIMARHSTQVSLKVTLHGTIRNDIVSNSYNTVPALQRCVALKTVVTNRPVYNHLYSGSKSFDSLTVVYLLNTPCPNKQDSSITGDDLEKKTVHFTGAPNGNFRKISVRKTI